MNEHAEIPSALEKVQRDWWLYLILGVVLIAVGAVAIAVPFATAVATATVLGVLFVLGGAVQAIYAFGLHQGAGKLILNLAIGALYAWAGVVLLQRPVEGAFVLTLVVAAVLFIKGIVTIALSMDLGELPHRGWLMVGGLLSLILGVLIALRWPSSAFWAIGLLVGIDLIYTGVTMAALSLGVHRVISGIQRLAGQH